MASYNAEIRLGVTGQRELEQARSSITRVNEAIDSLNRNRLNVGGLTQSLSAFETQLSRAARGLADVQLGSEKTTGALQNYLKALGTTNTAQANRSKLINDQIRDLQGLQTQEERNIEVLQRLNAVQSGRYKQKQEAKDARQFGQAKQDELELQQGLLRLEQKSAAVLNHKLELQEKLNGLALRQGAKDVSTVSTEAAKQQQLLAGKSGTVMQGPLAGPGAMGFRVALPLGKIEQQGLATETKKQEILQRMVATKQQLGGLAANLQRLDTNSVVAIADANRYLVAQNVQRKRALDLAKAQVQGPGSPGGERAFRQAGEKQAVEQKAARAQKMESVALGVGFPLMFGAGPASLAGSLAGSFVGNGFGGQILGGALGAAIDKLGVAAMQTGKSLASPIEGFEKLKEANLFASKSQEFYIQKLIETGRIAEATGAIQAQIIKKLGVSGYNDLTALANASNDLSKAWADFNLQLQAAVAGPLEGLLTWLTEVVRLSTASTQQQAERLDPAAFADAQMKAIGKTSKFGFGGNAAAYNKELDRLSSAIVNKNIAKVKPTQTTKLEDLNTIEAGIKAAEQQADTIKDAYRTGFRLQQQGIDLQRQGSDLQRRVAQDVYNKQQEILRLQVDNDRQRKQVAIEMVDLEYKRRISNEEGRVAAVLEAESALMKTKAEGEANIEAKKRLLELDIDKQKRETENYIFELGRTIDNIRRATANFEMDAADYRLKIQRQIGEQRRIEDAGQAAGAVQTTGGKSGVTADKVAGFPITSRQKMRKHPVTGAMRMHEGTDIGTPMDTALAYSVGGVVTKATTMGGYGKILEVKLDNGVTAFAAHLNNTLVKAGERFTAKQLLARTGETGVGTGPHLHMEGTKGGDSTAPLPYLVLDGKASKVAEAAKSPTAAKSSTTTKLEDAGSKIIPRPSVPTPGIADVQAGMESYNEKNAALRKQALSIEQQLQNIREQAALDNLTVTARGSKEIQQRKDALAYAKAELGTTGAGNQELQERLAFQAQSGVKIKIYQDANDDILAKTKLQGEERKKLELALATGLTYTKQQIDLDREALELAQQTRFEKEQAAIQAQLGVTGKGLQAGFIGQAGQAYESEMLKSGNVAQAQALATQTQALELATTKARALEGAYNDIGSATANLMTEGVAGLVAGTTTAQQVFADFLKNIGDALIKAAQQMIAQYIAIAAAQALANMFSPAAGASGASAGFKMPEIASGFGLGPQRMFADGGRPPVGVPSLVGEKGPELFVPSAAGTIIPAGPTAGIREAMANGTNGNGATAPVLNMSFETTRFGNTDYVSREQLEAAMMQTRAEATKAGARRGMTMTLDKLQQSPSTRSRVGLG